MKDEIRIITVNDDPEIKIRLAIKPSKEDKYSNRTIIIIPGWLSAIDNFLPLAEALQSYGNAIIYEPRGFGESITPHKKGLFSREEYNKELASVIRALDLEEKNFIILGSCSGGSQAFSYILDGKGLMPLALTVLHPQVHYGTPFWLPVLGWIPTFIMNFVQKMIIGIYRLYLKRKATEETKTVSWAAERLAANDDWCLRRYVHEFIIKYDIRGRQKEVDIPILMVTSEKDHFVNPEVSNIFLHHSNSEILQINTDAHRVHQDKEKEIAAKINEFLLKLKY